MEGVADKNIKENCEQKRVNEDKTRLSERSQINGNHESEENVLGGAQVNEMIEMEKTFMNENSTHDGITDSLKDTFDGLLMKGVADKNIEENYEQKRFNEDKTNLSERSQSNGNHETGGNVLEGAQVNEMIEMEKTSMNENSTHDGIIDSLKDTFDGLLRSFSCNSSKKQEVPMAVPWDEEFYKMDHKKRGHAVIFNHKTFAPELNADIRNGTDKDVESLKDVLKTLQFEVKVYNDLTIEKVLKKVKKWSTKDHSNNDCFVLICLTHGAKGNIEGVEELLAHNSKYRISELWQPFTADRCPSLAGKPKLFFFQACRGSKKDDGVILKLQVDSFSNSKETSELQTDGPCPSYTIPSNADFLFAYATIPGYYAWKTPSHGSWFIQSLCHVLSEHGSTMEINEIFINVKRRVAVKYESRDYLDLDFHGKKEIPSIDSRLIRKLVFSPKTDDNSNNISR